MDQSTGDQKDLVDRGRQAVELEGSRGGLKAAGQLKGKSNPQRCGEGAV